MKMKAKIAKLQARIKAWESLSKSVQGAYMKPGSEKK